MYFQNENIGIYDFGIVFVDIDIFFKFVQHFYVKTFYEVFNSLVL